MKNNVLQKLDYFFVLRPMLFFPGWVTLFSGYFIAYRNILYFKQVQIQAVDLVEVGLLLLLFGAAMGASFLLNQLKDVESDSLNDKLFIVAGGYLTLKAIRWEIGILLLIALFLASNFSVMIFILTLGFIFLTGYLYNYKPFTLKDSPFSSLIANALMGWCAFAIGWSVNNELSWYVVFDALPYLFLNTALYFFTTLPDMEGDRAAAKNTIAVLYGKKLTIRLAFLFFTLSIISAILNQDWMILSVLLMSATFFIQTLRNYSISSTVQTTKYSIAFFTLVICFKLPYFFILMLAGFFGTRWYFKRRFNYDYPNFNG